MHMTTHSMDPLCVGFQDYHVLLCGVLIVNNAPSSVGDILNMSRRLSPT
jgi:hypothetical protein